MMMMITVMMRKCETRLKASLAD